MDLDDLRIKNFDNKNIKYSLKIKDDMFNCLNYEVSETKILINEYKENVDYEVNVRALINGSSGDWSRTIKFKIDQKKNNREGGLFENNNRGGGLFGDGNPF